MHGPPCKQYIFWSYYTSPFSAVSFDGDPFTCQREKENEKSEGFPICHFQRSFWSDITAVKGLKARKSDRCWQHDHSVYAIQATCVNRGETSERNDTSVTETHGVSIKSCQIIIAPFSRWTAWSWTVKPDSQRVCSNQVTVPNYKCKIMHPLLPAFPWGNGCKKHFRRSCQCDISDVWQGFSRFNATC